MGLGIACAGRATPTIMEVNSSPGLEGIEKCTGLDIAGAFIDYIASRVDFPEIDLNHKMFPKDMVLLRFLFPQVQSMLEKQL